MSVYHGSQALAEIEKLARRVQELENTIVILKNNVKILQELTAAPTKGDKE